MKTQTQPLRKEIMWYKVKELSSTKGNSDNEIARQLGIDRRTVSKYKKMSETEFKSFIDTKRVYDRILDPYYLAVKKLLDSDNGLPAAVIEDRLKENYPDLPKVNSKTVYNFVQYVRRKENIFAPVHIRQTEAMDEVPYGSQAQVDFGEYKMRRSDKSCQKVYFFALVLSRSRYKYVFFQTKPFTGKTAVESHERAFEYIKGIPGMLLYDQDSVYLNKENLGDYLLADDFKQYRDERNINVSFCRKADPQTKGKVENVIRYVKHNFLRARTFYDIDRLNEEALGWLKRTANGTAHATTKRLPHDEWLIEKEFLKNFYPTAIIVRDKLPGYTVRKDNTISYHGNFYRVPYGTYNGNGTTVLLSVKEEALFLYDHQNNLIAEHLLSKEKGKIIGGTSYRRDRSLELVVLKQNTLLLRPNCNILATYIEEIHKDKPRYLRDNLKVIREVIGEYSEDLVYKALDYCLEHSLYNAFNLKETAEYYRKLTSMHKEPQVAVNPLRDGVQMRQFNTSAYIPERTSINQYDKILEEI